MRRRALLAGLAATGLAGCTNLPGTGDPSETPASPTDSPEEPTDSPTDSPGDSTDTPDDGATESLSWRQSVSGAVREPTVSGASLRYVSGSGPAPDRWLFVPTDGSLHALDPGTGEERWAVPFEDPVKDVAVAADAGLVVAHAGGVELGDEHVVRAVDAGGDPQWTFPGSAGADPYGPLELLGADGGRVFVASRDDQPRSSGERLWALDATTGESAWSAEAGDPGSSVITDDAVFVAYHRAVDTFARPDGERRWRYEMTEEYQFDTLRARGDRAFFATRTPESGTVHAVGPDGDHRWTAGEYASSVTLADRLYVGGGNVTALDLDTGDPVWETKSDGYGFLREGPVADGTLYAGGDGVAAYDTGTGERRWTWEADAEIVITEAATEGAVYAGTGGGSEAPNTVYARNAADGSERWTFNAADSLSALALGEHVYVGDADGTVFALPR